MKPCPRCATENRETANFCQNCGYLTQPANISRNSENLAQEMSKISQTSKKPFPILKVAVGTVLGLVLLCAIVVILAILKIKSTPIETTQSTQPTTVASVAPPRAIYTPKQNKSVEVGIRLDYLRKFCGPPDDTRSVSTAEGTSYVYEYELKSERIEKGCYGTFYSDTNLIVYRIHR